MPIWAYPSFIFYGLVIFLQAIIFFADRNIMLKTAINERNHSCECQHSIVFHELKTPYNCLNCSCQRYLGPKDTFMLEQDNNLWRLGSSVCVIRSTSTAIPCGCYLAMTQLMNSEFPLKAWIVLWKTTIAEMIGKCRSLLTESDRWSPQSYTWHAVEHSTH